MELVCQETERGFYLKFKGQKFHFTYPGDVWQKYPEDLKKVFIENIVHLLTINVPLIAGQKEVRYNTATPILKSFFRKVVLGGIPGSVEDYEVSTDKVIKQFLSTRYLFNDFSSALPKPNNGTLNERAIISVSFGKDSLLSLALGREIGLNPVIMYVNDTVSPTENKLKLRLGKTLAQKLNLKHFVVRNEIEKLNDFEFWDKDETCVGYTHMVTEFCLSTLPLANYLNSRYIILGNQQNMNFQLLNKDGYLTYPSFDQTTSWTKQQNIMVNLLTAKKFHVMSVIEPLTDMMITKILFNRYQDIGKYQASCPSLDASEEKRWCHACSLCATTTLFMLANAINPKIVGLRSRMLDKKHEKYYSLFGGQEADCYDLTKGTIDEQLFAFYKMCENGVRGYLIDKFKKELLDEAVAREDELTKKYFTPHKSETMPKEIKKKILGIFKEELDA